jgi:hypothetical protein
MEAMRGMMDKLRLVVNEQKTRLCRVPHESFDFLGYTLGRCYSPRTGKAYIGTRPAKEKVMALCREISAMTACQLGFLPAEEMVADINSKLMGWANYFCLGPVSKAYHAVDRHVRQRLRQWLCRKHKVQGRGISRFSGGYLYQTLGLIALAPLTHNFPWAKT